MLQSLQRLGLLRDPESARYEMLTGGVSSDIWKIDADGRAFCVKRQFPGTVYLFRYLGKDRA